MGSLNARGAAMARLLVPLLLIISMALSVAALKWLPAPYLWISLAWVIACVVAMRIVASTAMRVLWLNLGVIAATLGALEAWASISATRPSASTTTYTPEAYHQPDDILGRTYTPSRVTRVRKWYGTTLLYDVTYTIGPDGLRVSPPGRGGPPTACVIFFGDSFTFGEGLNDTETLPYRVGAIGGGRFVVYNFGFHGYGPHQMLSALEHGRVASILKCRPTHVIYSAIRDHVARVVALNTWGGHDPRYRLEPGGSVRYDGHFDGDKPPVRSRLGARVHKQLGKSALYLWITSRRRRVTEQDLELFVGIVAQARRIVESSYPGCVFEILLWNGEPDEATEARGLNGRRPSDIEWALRRVGFAPRIVENILPSYQVDSASYILSPFDAHPSARANDLLARDVVRSIIEAPHRP